MTFADFSPLVATTLRDPRAAARQIMAMRLPRDVFWTALALVAAINSFVLTGMVSMAPVESQAQFPSYFASPLAVFVLMAGMMVIYIHVVFWSGRALSGKGQLDDVIAVLVWLQLLRTAAQIAIIAVATVLPQVAGLLSLVALGWGLWILFSFIAETLALPSIGHAVLVLFMAIVGFVLGVTFLMTLIGGFAQGDLSNV